MKMAVAIMTALSLGGMAMGSHGAVSTQRRSGVENGSRVECADGRAVSTEPPTTGNLSKARRERLIAEMGEIRTFLERSADTNATRLIRFAAKVEREVRDKKYGLVFEEHCERVDEELLHNVPVLSEVKERFVDGGKFLTQSRRDAEGGRAACPYAAPLNFLIEGDNLAALKLLEKTHRGKIDLIYIDPPYNTGNKDFIYNDSYVDKTDTFRHSKWLSFMQKRLEIARRLMSDKGVIFISIDDNEQAALKLLCDDVFGESNFAGIVIWQSATDNNPRQISTEHEYVVCYCKNMSKQGKWLYKSEKAALIKAKYDELKTAGGNIAEIERLLRKWIKENKEALKGVAHYNNVDERGVYSSSSNSSNTKPGGYMFDIVHPVTGKSCVKPAYGWRWTETTFWNYANNGDVEWGKDETTQPHIKKRIDTVEEQFKSIYYEDGRAATAMLEGIFGEKKVFDNPKPVSLIMRIARFASSGDSTVLDFFAGSGTTGHAVMKLNAEDGGRRRFILVTNNENGICEKVTYERLKRVIKRDKYAASVKYFKVDYVPIDGKVYYDYADDLLKHIRELVELENSIDFKTDSTIAIAVTDKEFEKFVSSDKKMDGKKALYVGHDVLIGKPARQKLERRGIEIRIIPQYYYSEQEA
ncbi:MAG: site-specific DNA-methyltransferase [Kiritimatiellae bacterium]|nr:site-specific DNA-methyltransferase [Kiritimatiellia bacterium]